MKIVLQRVSQASVTVNNEIIGEIGRGLLLLVGFSAQDTSNNFDACIEKILNLRIFQNAEKHFDLSLRDINGEVLAVSQFTLLAETAKGRRPDFFKAMPPDPAKSMYDDFIKRLKSAGIKNVQTGEFGADMKVSLINDGPVTLLLDF